MAEFNPRDNQPSTPVYTDTSRLRGYEGNESAGIIGKGLAQALDAGVKGLDANIQENIEQDVESGFDVINAEFGIDSATEFGAGIPGETVGAAPGTVTGGSPGSPGRPSLPSAIANAGDHLADLQSAHQSGALKDSYYWMRLNSMVRQLRGKYPGYRTEIDSIVQSVTGSRPANQLRDALFQEWGTESTGVKARNELIKTMGNEGSQPPDLFERESSGNPYTFAELNKIHNDFNKEQAITSAETAKLNQLSAERKITADEAEQGWRVRSNQIVRQGLERIASGSGMTYDQLIAASQNPGVLDAGTIDSIRTGLTQLRSQIEGTLGLELTKSWDPENGDPGRSYNAWVPPENVSKINDQALQPLGILERAFFGDKPMIGLAGRAAAWVEGSKSDITRQIFEQKPDLGVMAAMADEFGSDFMNTWFTFNEGARTTWVDNIAELDTGKILINPMNQDKISSNPNNIPSTNASMAEDWEFAEKKNLPPGYFKTSMNIWKGMSKELTSGAVPPDAIARYVQYVFGPDNWGLVTQVDDPVQFLTEMASPEITKQMQALRDAGDVTSYQTYKQWLVNGFQSTLKTQLDTLKQYNVNRNELMVAFDPTTNQFTYVTNPEFEFKLPGSSQSGLGGMMSRGIERSLFRPFSHAGVLATQDAINQVNKVIGTIVPVLTDEGQPIPDVLKEVFFRAGFTPSAKTETATPDQTPMPDAFSEALEAAPTLTTEDGGGGEKTGATFLDENSPFQPQFRAPGETQGKVQGEETSFKPEQALDDASEIDVDPRRAPQYAFVMHEFNTTEKNAFSQLQQATSVEEAVDAGLQYLRPGIPHRDQRVLEAQKIYNGEGSEEAQKAYNYFQTQGLSPEQAAGLVGNFVVESRNVETGEELDPHVEGDSLELGGNASIGIAQWQGSRRDDLVNFLQNYAPTDSSPAQDAINDFVGVSSFEDIDPSSTPAATDADIIDDTGVSQGRWHFGKMQGNALVIHHTAGRGDVNSVIRTFQQRNFPAHFVIDRQGKIHEILPPDRQGQHTKNSEINDVSNKNSWGVEIIANDDRDVLPVQAEAAVKLTKYLHDKYGLPYDRVFGHGEINSHKQATEGSTVKGILSSLQDTQLAGVQSFAGVSDSGTKDFEGLSDEEFQKEFGKWLTEDRRRSTNIEDRRGETSEDAQSRMNWLELKRLFSIPGAIEGIRDMLTSDPDKSMEDILKEASSMTPQGIMMSEKNPGVPDALQNVLDRYAQGKAKAIEVKKIAKGLGYDLSLRGKSSTIDIFGPDGKSIQFDF